VTHYGGTTTIINSVHGHSYTIFPEMDEMVCHNTTSCVDETQKAYTQCKKKGARPHGVLQHLFPENLALFKATGATKFIRRCRFYKSPYSYDHSNMGHGGEYTRRGRDPVLCSEYYDEKPIEVTEWQFHTGQYGGLSEPGMKSKDQLFLGSYMMYTSIPNDVPVQLKLLGHNVILIDSHYDEYVIDYFYIRPVKHMDSEILSPPNGMSCANKPAKSSGPVEFHQKVRRAHESLHDQHMLMPEGAAMRTQKFQEYNQAFGKRHADDQDYATRYTHFHGALRYVNAFNRQRKNYHLRINHLADWTPEERTTLKGVQWTEDSIKLFVVQLDSKPHHRRPMWHSAARGVLPHEVDWRQRHSVRWTAHGKRDASSRGWFVTPAKDQGTCGSCWSFGAAGTVEGQLANVTRNDAKGDQYPTEVSEQNLMDCSWRHGNHGCDGGLDWQGFNWMLHANGGRVATASTYGPYMNEAGWCHYDNGQNLTKQVVVNGQKFNPRGSIPIREWGTTAVYGCHPHCTARFYEGMRAYDMANALEHRVEDTIAATIEKLWTHGPLSVSINASPQDFYFYGGGVYDNHKECDSRTLDHNVLAVGYGTMEDGSRYWIIKNSWSSHWGEEGFVRVAQKHNTCGVANTPNYVVM